MATPADPVDQLVAEAVFTVYGLAALAAAVILLALYYYLGRTN